MGTSLTPEFWERFAILLVAAMAVTVVVAAALDALIVRVPRRHAHRPPTHAPHRPKSADRRTSAHC
ncbi:hypothetical protein [Streptomyces chartreusis]|uniref:hypothetical protein n=1 Tax=Streptomyces chartreusis TaxID=1969 RepID=UPI00362CE919